MRGCAFQMRFTRLLSCYMLLICPYLIQGKEFSRDMITFLVSILLISIYGVKVNCKVESYALNILERGTMFKEIVEVDVENQTEIFRVPQHNDVAAMDMMNDFKKNLTVRRIPSTQDCYVSKLDSSTPAPARMEFNMKQVSSRFLRGYQLTTKKSALRVVGLANRLALPEKFLEFCGSFPIYNIEQTSPDSMKSSLKASLEEGRQGHWRGKRKHKINSFSTCGTKGVNTMTGCLAKKNDKQISSGQHVRYNLKCEYKTQACFYVVDCYPAGQGIYECKKIAHFRNYLDICCNLVC